MASTIARRRLRALAKQKGLCFYCQCPLYEAQTMDLASFARRHALSLRQGKQFLSTAEHLLPQSEGGGNRAENIVAACCRCNQTRPRRRKALPFEAYRTFVRGRLGRGKWHPRWVHDAVLPGAQ